MGSGTTGVACKLLNRNFIGMEINNEYFEIAKKRIEETKIEEIIENTPEENIVEDIILKDEEEQLKLF